MKTNKTTNRATNRATNKALTFKQRLALTIHSARFSVYYINPHIKYEVEPSINPQLVKKGA